MECTVMKYHKFAFIALFIVSVYICSATARTWTIEPDGTGDAPTIQAGVDSAAVADTVLLASGVFTGVGNHDIDLLGKAITVTSEAGAASTIIDCQNLGCAFSIKSGEIRSTVISDLTIQNGFSSFSGGAVKISFSSPTIRSNIFRNNSSGDVNGGGAIAVFDESSPLIEHNIFKENNAPDGGAIVVAQLFPYASYAHIEANTFVDNSATSEGGALYIYGVSPTILNNTFCRNSATWGGAIWIKDSGASVDNNIIAYSIEGGGIDCNALPIPSFTCNDVSGNIGGDYIDCIGGSGNFSADPQFCGVYGTDNFYLQSDSPCAPGNHPDEEDCGLIGALPVSCGTVASEQKTWGEIKAIYKK